MKDPPSRALHRPVLQTHLSRIGEVVIGKSNGPQDHVILIVDGRIARTADRGILVLIRIARACLNNCVSIRVDGGRALRCAHVRKRIRGVVGDDPVGIISRLDVVAAQACGESVPAPRRQCRESPGPKS
jgi:hypothetical protein